MLVYLDNCCYNRPYDEQCNLIIRLKTEAKLYIQDMIKNEQISLVWSGMLDYENNDNPFWERKMRIAEWEDIADVVIELDENILNNAQKYMLVGLKNKDAIHIACAVQSKADYFITTDNKILNKQINDIKVINPVDFVRKELNYYD